MSSTFPDTIITLRSDACMDFYPNNKPTNFTNLLLQEILLPANSYVCALEFYSCCASTTTERILNRPTKLITDCVQSRQFGMAKANVLKIFRLDDFNLSPQVYVAAATEPLRSINVKLEPLNGGPLTFDSSEVFFLTLLFTSLPRSLQ